MKIGEKIRLMCRKENIKFKEFSDLVDIPYGTVRHHIKGRQSPNIKQIQKITTHPRFKKYASWLIGEAEAPFDHSEWIREPAAEYSTIETDDEEILAMFAKLDESRKNAMKRQIEQQLAEQNAKKEE